MSFARLLDRTATVRRKQRTGDGQGGWAETWTDHLGAEPCRRSSPAAADRTVAQQVQAVVTETVYFRAGTDVAYDDQVAVDGRLLRVEAVIEPSKAVYRKALCSEVAHGSGV